MSEKIKGTVKFFNAEKGFGFISRDDGDDIFVAARDVENSGLAGLAEKQRVQFDVGQGKKGPKAINIELL